MSTQIARILKDRTGNDWTFDKTLTAKEVSTQLQNWNPDPNEGNQSGFPISPTAQSFQLITIQGSKVIELTTTSGFFVWLPAWLEKVMCWHIPTDDATQTFGTPTRIDFSLDADQFYERYRVIVSSLRVQAGTVSVTNAALAGNCTAVSAYNSIASWVGNNSTVFQIYSYENGPGLTPEVEDKIVGVQSWNGVALMFCNSPDARIQRLEDSVVFEAQDADPTTTTAKFVNDDETYDLNVKAYLPESARVFSLPADASYYRINLGKYLKDGVRASSIAWGLTTSIVWIANGPVGTLNDNKVQFQLGYELEDITQTVVQAGVLYTRQYKIPTISAVPSQNEPIVLSGCMPDTINIEENDLKPPIRQVNFYFSIRNMSTENMEINLNDFIFSCRYPVLNGMTPGVIQEPKIIFYTGAEIGTKMTVNGSVRVEAYPDAVRSKFVNNLHRKYDELQAVAIKKLLCNPTDYGVRWAMPASAYEGMIETFACGLHLAMEEEPSLQLLAIVNQLMNMAKHYVVEHSSGSTKNITHDASLKSLSKKAIRAFNKVGKNVFNESIKPVLQQEWEVIKQLPLSAAKQVLQQTVGPMMTSYTPPTVSYQQPSNNVVSVKSTHKAASGFIPRASLNNRYHACCFDVDEIGATDEDQNFVLQFQKCHNAAVRVPKSIFTKKTAEKSNDIQSFAVPVNKINVFTTVTTLDDSKLVEDDIGSAVNGFAITPSSLLPAALRNTPVLLINGKTLSNFSYYDNIKDPLRVAPKENVSLLRIRAIDHAKDQLLVETTDKPVGGRSLELAMSMFNNGIHGLIAFTGAVDEGRVRPMADSTAALKDAWCKKNGILTVGNGNFDIKVHSIVDALKQMRDMARTKTTSTHHNSRTHIDLRCFDIPEFEYVRPLMTSESTLQFVDEDDVPPTVAIHFNKMNDVIVATKLIKPLEFDTKFGIITEQNGEKFDSYFLPSIKSRHTLTKDVIRKHLDFPKPTNRFFDTGPQHKGLNVAMNVEPQTYEYSQQALPQRSGRGRPGRLRPVPSYPDLSNAIETEYIMPHAPQTNIPNFSQQQPPLTNRAYRVKNVTQKQYRVKQPIQIQQSQPDVPQYQPQYQQFFQPQQYYPQQDTNTQVQTQQQPRTRRGNKYIRAQVSPLPPPTEQNKKHFRSEIQKAKAYQNDEIIREADILMSKVSKAANKINPGLYRYLTDQCDSLYEISQALRGLRSLKKTGLTPLALKWYGRMDEVLKHLNQETNSTETEPNSNQQTLQEFKEQEQQTL